MMKNKIILLIFLALFIILAIVWGNISLGNGTKLNQFVSKEKDTISEVFYEVSTNPFLSNNDIKTTKVKDLYDFRRYLFIMPQAYIHAHSIAQSEEIQRSFPKACKIHFKTYPNWLDYLGPLKVIFRGQALYKCHQI
jgi:hypothetical protein